MNSNFVDVITLDCNESPSNVSSENIQINFTNKTITNGDEHAKNDELIAVCLYGKFFLLPSNRFATSVRV